MSRFPGHFLVPLGGFWDVPRPDKTHKLFIILLVYLWVSYQLDMSSTGSCYGDILMKGWTTEMDWQIYRFCWWIRKLCSDSNHGFAWSARAQSQTNAYLIRKRPFTLSPLNDWPSHPCNFPLSCKPLFWWSKQNKNIFEKPETEEHTLCSPFLEIWTSLQR